MTCWYHLEYLGIGFWIHSYSQADNKIQFPLLLSPSRKNDKSSQKRSHTYKSFKLHWTKVFFWGGDEGDVTKTWLSRGIYGQLYYPVVWWLYPSQKPIWRLVLPLLIICEAQHFSELREEKEVATRSHEILVGWSIFQSLSPWNALPFYISFLQNQMKHLPAMSELGKIFIWVKRNVSREAEEKKEFGRILQFICKGPEYETPKCYHLT